MPHRIVWHIVGIAKNLKKFQQIDKDDISFTEFHVPCYLFASLAEDPKKSWWRSKESGSKSLVLDETGTGGGDEGAVK